MKISVAALLLLLQTASAYEVETHVRFSQMAASCSVLKDQGMMENLGLKGLEDEDPLWRKPVDTQDKKPGKWIAAWMKEYTKQGNLPAYESSIKTLIGWGAKFEDEEFKKRPLNHFFDPLNGQAFHPCPPFSDCNTSPDWALEDGLPQPDLTGQGNSFFDAYEHLFNAAGNVPSPAPADTLNALSSRNKLDREQAWTRVFQSLGMVIHHLQDMSQPQHVRNDAHCDEPICALAGQYDPSWYEKYTNIHRQVILNQYACTDYPKLDLARFSHSRDFWINPMHYGQAEYTNRNFVSKDTNFRWKVDSLVSSHVAPDSAYGLPDPQNDGAGLIEEKIDICDPALLGPGFQLCGEMRFLGTWVGDNYLQGAPKKLNKRSSSYSLWTNKLDEYNVNAFTGDVERVFNLNRFNFEAAYDFLFPRAIAYSAGLIDYFFRGRMAVSEVSYIGGDKVSLMVTNTTAEENPGNAPFAFSGLTSSQPGRFYLYQDEADGARWELEAANEEDASLTSDEKFKAGDKLVLEFLIPANVDFDLDKPLTLVYDGLIGEERGIAVASFSLSRLLAFDVSRTASGAPVPNIVDIYQSQDSGASWQPVTGIEIPVTDTTPDWGDRLAVQAVVYVGDGELLLYPDYRNYDGFQPYTEAFWAVALKRFGQMLGTAVPLDMPTWLAGQGNNAADHNAVLRSLTYTGDHSLAALHTRHPDSGAAPPRIRTFGLLQIPDWTLGTAWLTQPGWGEGGLPELSWRGGDRYAMAAYVECIEQNPPCSPQHNTFGSALRATDDAGATYRDLTSFTAECTPDDFFCIQFIRPLDAGRLLGWVTRRGTVDPGPVTLYVSNDDGASWSVYGAAPTPTGCQGIDHPYAVVDDIVYLGSKHPNSQPAKDSLFIQMTCNRINTDSAGQVFIGFEEIGRSAFATSDSGVSWITVVDPPHNNGRVIFADDNGVVPGLYGP